MDGDYTKPADCPQRHDFRSYQVGLRPLGADGEIAGPSERPAGWEWNVYGGDWHLMSGEADAFTDAVDAAHRWIEADADAVMHFLMSKGR